MDAFGRAPDFLDGHHHAHQLPVVRDVVLDLWRRRMGRRGWIRCCCENPVSLVGRGVDIIRAMVISELGRGLRRQLIAHHVPHNRSFRGVYDLSNRVPYGELFRAFTNNPPPGTLVMCHPGHVDDALIAVDRVTTRREAEYDYLVSYECGQSLRDRGIVLGRLG